jgi:hypothetical protein
VVTSEHGAYLYWPVLETKIVLAPEHPMLSDLANATASSVYRSSLLKGEVTDDWNLTPVAL